MVIDSHFSSSIQTSFWLFALSTLAVYPMLRYLKLRSYFYITTNGTYSSKIKVFFQYVIRTKCLFSILSISILSKYVYTQYAFTFNPPNLQLQ